MKASCQQIQSAPGIDWKQNHHLFTLIE